MQCNVAQIVKKWLGRRCPTAHDAVISVIRFSGRNAGIEFSFPQPVYLWSTAVRLAFPLWLILGRVALWALCVGVGLWALKFSVTGRARRGVSLVLGISTTTLSF